MDNLTSQQIIDEFSETNMTHAELASKSGVPIGTVHRILSGSTKSPRFDTLLAMHQAMKHPADPDERVLLLHFFEAEIRKKDRWICVLACLCVILFICLVCLTPKYW